MPALSNTTIMQPTLILYLPRDVCSHYCRLQTTDKSRVGSIIIRLNPRRLRWEIICVEVREFAQADTAGDGPVFGALVEEHCCHRAGIEKKAETALVTAALRAGG